MWRRLRWLSVVAAVIFASNALAIAAPVVQETPTPERDPENCYQHTTPEELGLPYMSEADYIELASSEDFVDQFGPYFDVTEWWIERIESVPRSDLIEYEGYPDIGLADQIRDLTEELSQLNEYFKGQGGAEADYIAFMLFQPTDINKDMNPQYSPHYEYNALFGADNIDLYSPDADQFLSIDGVIRLLTPILDYHREQPGNETFVAKGDELLRLLNLAKQIVTEGYLITINRRRAGSVEEALEMGLASVEPVVPFERDFSNPAHFNGVITGDEDVRVFEFSLSQGDVVTTLAPGTVVDVIARDQFSTSLQITVNDVTGWVANCKIEVDGRVSHLPNPDWDNYIEAYNVNG